MADIRVADPEVVWSVATALGTRSKELADYVVEAEEYEADRARRRGSTRQEIRDAMRPPFK